MKLVHRSFALLFMLALAGCGTTAGKPQAKAIAPLFEGLGNHSMPVSTKDARAQQYFDQGLALTYAFNHAEAVLSFKEAARLDPALAMAHFGEALALGPNINQPLSPEHEAQAKQAIVKAQSLLAGATAKEKALIEALAGRYGQGERAGLDTAYAEKMRQLAAEFPDDADIATLAVAAFMETTPWNYWGKGSQPNPGVADIQAFAETTLNKWPSHAGAIHYYIHLIEASDHAGKAERYADRLGQLMPGAGHMVHMASHIYFRVGRYADAVRVNLDAIAADERYMAQQHAHGLYPKEYYAHNIHFLWAAATLDGRGAMALEASKKSTGKACCVGKMLAKDDLQTTATLALVRFGKWDDILALPKPAAEARYATAINHYARGVALAVKGDLDGAAKELAALRAIQTSDALKPVQINFSPGADVVKLAGNIVEAEIAARKKNYGDAIRLLTEAAAIEDTLAYMEPPTWHHPVRQILGAIQLEAGKPADAEQTYRDDLRKWPENGWSLTGLVQALRAQNKTDIANATEGRLRKAWGRADVKLTGSVIR